jgi:SAM-dependent methyltransferase
MNGSVLPDRHLDLGCGTKPRNPYRRSFLFGIDIRQLSPEVEMTLQVADLCHGPIPFPDNHFGSVSAFDYLEHVPRVVLDAGAGSTRFPFVTLMNEIHRVLAPGGRLYALTPCYPHPAAFQDPTHVNIITPETHAYFCGENPTASIYGFTGRFQLLRAEWVVYEDATMADRPGFLKRLRRIKKSVKRQLSHFLWELEKF